MTQLRNAIKFLLPTQARRFTNSGDGVRETKDEAAMTTLPFEQNAVISACGMYRYVLTRQVGAGTQTATFIMLNPSTADDSTDDPTIRRCSGFARQWGCGRLTVLNLFAFRAIHPSDLKRAKEPVGPENWKWFERILSGSPHKDSVPIICGWGVHGKHRGQDQVVLRWLDALSITPFALGVTKDGHPKHPLYVPYSVELIPLA